MSIMLNISKERELVDLLYQSYVELTRLQAELTECVESMASHALTVVPHPSEKPATESHHGAASTPVSDQTKKLQKALAKQLTVQKNLTKVVKLLTQNHTDAATILNEFEKIRTSELLRSEAFALAHVLPINDTSAG